MKLFLVVALLVSSVGSYAYADEDSANSARSSENSPVIPAAEGEGELTLDSESGTTPKKPKTLGQQMDIVCKANADCEKPNVKKSNSKKAVKKAKPKKKTEDD